MTEKRFTLDFDDPRAVWIDDNSNDKSYTVINDTLKKKNIQEIVALLNEQHETIEDLKDVNVRCCNEYNHFHKRMMELEKENEELKYELKYYKAMVHTDTSR